MTWSNGKLVQLAAVFYCLAALSGCGGSDSASYLIDGTPDRALTLIRDKAYLWSDGWSLQMVVTSQPECLRRHNLKRGADGNFKMFVYRSRGGAFILKQGKRWYVTEIQKCQLQQYEEPPPDPGELIGLFEAKGEPLHFSLASADSKSAPEAAAKDEAPARPAR